MFLHQHIIDTCKHPPEGNCGNTPKCKRIQKSNTTFLYVSTTLKSDLSIDRNRDRDCDTSLACYEIIVVLGSWNLLYSRYLLQSTNLMNKANVEGGTDNKYRRLPCMATLRSTELKLLVLSSFCFFFRFLLRLLLPDDRCSPHRLDPPCV